MLEIIRKNLLIIWLIIALIFGISIILFLYFINQTEEFLSSIILWLTGIVLLFYTIETRNLRISSDKQLKEIEKQTNLQTRPFLRLEFNWDYKKQYPIWKSENALGKKRKEPAIMYLVNDGKGIAREISLADLKIIEKSPPPCEFSLQFDNIAVIGPNSQSSGIFERNIKFNPEEVKQDNYLKDLYILLNPEDNNYELITTFYDVNKNEPSYKYKFISDPKDKDGFRIEEYKD